MLPPFPLLLPKEMVCPSMLLLSEKHSSSPRVGPSRVLVGDRMQIEPFSHS